MSKLIRLNLCFVSENYDPGKDDCHLMREVVAFAFGPQPSVRNEGDWTIAQIQQFIPMYDAVLVSCRGIGPKVMAAIEAAKEAGVDIYLAIPYSMGGQGLAGLTEFVARVMLNKITAQLKEGTSP